LRERSPVCGGRRSTWQLFDVEWIHGPGRSHWISDDRRLGSVTSGVQARPSERQRGEGAQERPWRCGGRAALGRGLSCWSCFRGKIGVRPRLRRTSSIASAATGPLARTGEHLLGRSAGDPACAASWALSGTLSSRCRRMSVPTVGCQSGQRWAMHGVWVFGTVVTLDLATSQPPCQLNTWWDSR